MIDALDALESQLSALRSARVTVSQITARGVRAAKVPADAQGIHLHMALTQSEAAQHLLPSATPYYWTAQTAAAVESASRQYPLDDAVLTPERLRDPCVWFWCDEGFFSVEAGQPDGSLTPTPIYGMVAGIDRSGLPKLVAVGFCRNGRAPYSVLSGAWMLGEKVHSASSLRLVGADARETSDEDPRRRLFRFVLCAQQWLSQRILTASPVLLERHARKRAARELKTEPAVQVVTLRARESSRVAGSGDGSAVDWQCRWIVSGHWRAQYYPSTGERVPIWVAPHLKGPSDKPLKPPRVRVFPSRAEDAPGPGAVGGFRENRSARSL